MKAIVLKDFGSTDNFELNPDMPMPEMGETDVLVCIKATAFNPIDYQIRQGKSERKRMHSPVLGREFSGSVVKTGKQVQGFTIGDEVLSASGSMGSNGTYAEYISVPQEILVHKPRGITFEEAAAIPIAALTALQCYHRLSIGLQDSVFVSGAAGGVGLVLIKLLLAKGHNKITVTAGNEESKHQLMNAGLREKQIVHYRIEDPAKATMAANEGRLFPYCVDLVGGNMSELCAQVLMTNGTYADVTALSTDIAREGLFNKGAVLVNISNYAYSSSENRAYYGETLREFVQLVEHGIILPSPVLVVGGLMVETVKNAHKLLESNLTRGKKLVMQVTR